MSIEEGNVEDNELDPSLFAEAPEEAEPQVEERQEPEEDIPAKYRGKTASDIIRMHQDAERLLGKQGNEVGELRKVVDDILSNQQAQTSAPAEPEVDFFEDPKGAIAKSVQAALGSDPRLKALEADRAENTRKSAAAELAQRHPDYMEVVNDPSFGEWISKSKARTKQFQESHSTFDTDTAASLLDDWKERQDLVKRTTANASAKRGEKVKQASTGTGKASSETRGKPFLSRHALIELKQSDPDKYYANIAQIKAAYVEGRVRD